MYVSVGARKDTGRDGSGAPPATAASDVRVAGRRPFRAAVRPPPSSEGKDNLLTGLRLRSAQGKAATSTAEKAFGPGHGRSQEGPERGWWWWWWWRRQWERPPGPRRRRRRRRRDDQRGGILQARAPMALGLVLRLPQLAERPGRAHGRSSERSGFGPAPRRLLPQQQQPLLLPPGHLRCPRRRLGSGPRGPGLAPARSSTWAPGSAPRSSHRRCPSWQFPTGAWPTGR